MKASIFSIDGLSGFPEAIKATYPKAIIQRCIIHQIRASARYVSSKHRKEHCRNIKAIYSSANEEKGFRQLEFFKDKWNSLYPTGIKFISVLLFFRQCEKGDVYYQHHRKSEPAIPQSHERQGCIPQRKAVVKSLFDH